MFITGRTEIKVNGKSTRVLGRPFNLALKTGTLAVTLPTGEPVTPSKRTWAEVAEQIRAGKKVQAKAG